MTEDALLLMAAVSTANEKGGWPAYIVHYLGMADTGDETLDYLLSQLYEVNEAVHKRANQLCLEYNIPFMGEE